MPQPKLATQHKSGTCKFYVTINGERVNVCKVAFASLYKIGRKKIEIVQNKMRKDTSPEPDKRGKHANRPNKVCDNVRSYVKKHIASFPAEYSHYSRAKNPHRQYLPPTLSVPKLYQLYLEQCRVEKKPDTFLVTQSMYRTIFVSEFNLSFARPKSDTCSTCDGGQCTEEHIEFYQVAFNTQKRDRERSSKIYK